MEHAGISAAVALFPATAAQTLAIAAPAPRDGIQVTLLKATCLVGRRDWPSGRTHSDPDSKCKGENRTCCGYDKSH